jgi:hypothetical protein
MALNPPRPGGGVTFRGPTGPVMNAPRAGGGTTFRGSSRPMMNSPYGTPGGRSAAEESSGGWLHNLLSDAEDTIYGLGGLAVAAGHEIIHPHPIWTSKGSSEIGSLASFGKAVAVDQYHWWKPLFQAYGDLAQGDIGGAKRHTDAFNEMVKQHPLSLLNAAILFPAGIARAGAVGVTRQLLKEGVELEPGAMRGAILRGHVPGPTTALTARLGAEAEPIPIRSLPRNYYRQERMKAVDAALKKLSGGTPIVGEFKRAARATEKHGRVPFLEMTTDPRYHDFVRAWTGLKKNERAAFVIQNLISHPQHIQMWEDLLRRENLPEAKQMVKQLKNPKIVELMKGFSTDPEKANKKLMDAYEKGRALSDLRTEVMKKYGALTPAEAIFSPFRNIQILRGAKYATPARIRNMMRRVDAEINRVSKQKGKLFTARSLKRRELDKTLATGRRRANEVISGDLRYNRMASRLQEVADERESLRAELTKLRDQLDLAMANEFDKLPLSEFDLGEEQQIIPQMTEGGVAQLRTELLGKMYDRLGPLYDRYERAVVAENMLQKQAAKIAEAKADLTKTPSEIKAANDQILDLLHAQRAKLVELTDYGFLLQQVRQELPSQAGKLIGGPRIQKIVDELQAAKKPLPFYMPNVPSVREGAKMGGGRYASPVGSIAAQRIRGDIYQSRGLLFRTGMIALYPDVLSPSFLRAARHALNSDLHSIAVRIAVPVARHESLPAGHEWLRRTRGQKISFAQTARGQHVKETEEIYGPTREEDWTSPEADLRIRAPEEIAERTIDNRPYRLAVPKAYADAFRAERLQSNRFVRWFVTKPLDVWRHLILHTRIPWLLANVVGNTTMFALRFAGAGGITAFLKMVATTHGMDKVRELLTDKKIVDALGPEWTRRVLPEQHRGVAMATEMPSPLFKIPANNIPDWLIKLARVPKHVVRALPTIDKWTEMGLRRAAVNAIVSSDPKVQSVVGKMKAEATAWKKATDSGQIGPAPAPPTLEHAAERAFREEPGLRESVNRDVNDALGDFLSLTLGERKVIRELVPFYAWIREITRITAKMPLDHPVRTMIMYQLGQIYGDLSAQEVPSFMRGMIPLGMTPDGLQRGIAIHSMIPWATPIDMLRAYQAFLPGATREEYRALYGNLNPFVAGILKTAQTGNKLGLALGPAQEVYAALPQTRTFNQLPPFKWLSEPIESPLYPTRTADQRTYEYFGWPVRTYDPEVARIYKEMKR